MCAIFCVLVGLLTLGVHVSSAYYDPYGLLEPDLMGNFCANRSVPCCTSRQDSCSAPILGHICYCDQFCDRPENSDCCPDYQYVCRGRPRPTLPPPPIELPSCLHEGRYYNQGTSLKINCNDCKCERICESRSCRTELVCTQHPCLVDPNMISQINQGNVGWRAANYSVFWGQTLDRGFAQRLGTKHSKRRVNFMRPIKPVFNREDIRRTLRYDLRVQRRGMVSPPRDQGWCAADWVISTVQIATDRLAIISKGEDRATLSPQHLLSCNSKNQRGCNGGHITRAWRFIQKFGLVPEACYPWVGYQTNCSVSKLKDKTRTSARCVDGNNFMPLHRTAPLYPVSSEPESIMYEIKKSGPVQAIMKVSQDFFSYRSGVYHCGGPYSRSRRNDTYHSVRIVGWDEEVYQGNTVKYWIVSNSWGTWWGEGGYFRIRRGVNECEIESLVLGAWINPIWPKKDPSMPMMDNNNTISNTIYR